MAAFTTAAILIGLGISAATAAKGAYDQHKAGKAAIKAGEAEKRAAFSQAGLLDLNAKFADMEADDIRNVAALEEETFRKEVKGVIGSIRAGQAMSNVDVGYGSALDVQADAAFLGELDALQIRSNAQRTAWGYRVEAYNYRQQADVVRKEGVNAALAARELGRGMQAQAWTGVLGVGASLLQMRYGFTKSYSTAPALSNSGVRVGTINSGQSPRAART